MKKFSCEKNPAMKKWPKKMRRMNMNMNIRTQRYPIPTTYITRVLHPFQMFFVGQTMSSGKEAIAAVWYSWGYSWYCESTNIQGEWLRQDKILMRQITKFLHITLQCIGASLGDASKLLQNAGQSPHIWQTTTANDVIGIPGDFSPSKNHMLCSSVTIHNMQIIQQDNSVHSKSTIQITGG